MKYLISHICSYCGKSSTKYGDIWNCEAEHLGLTPTEYMEYRWLLDNTQLAEGVALRTENPVDMEKYHKLIKQLDTFERENILAVGGFIRGTVSTVYC